MDDTCLTLLNLYKLRKHPGSRESALKSLQHLNQRQDITYWAIYVSALMKIANKYMNEFPDELISGVAAKLVIELRTIDTLTPLHDKDALVQEFKNKSRLFTSQYLKRCFPDTPGGEQT